MPIKVIPEDHKYTNRKKMKVLIACNRDSYKNPFVSTLADGIIANGVDVTCSIDEFWNDWQKYDIIHLQWPNLLIKGLTSVEPLQRHLQEIKDAKIPLVVTCHNLHPHYNNKEVINQAYDVVYGMANCIVHMGEYSYDLMSQQYPATKHVIIPHHIYDKLYPEIPSKNEAIQHLGLDPTKRYVLCFGAFRDDEEREIAKEASDYLSPKGFAVLAPGFSRFKAKKNIIKVIKEHYLFLKRRLRFRNIIFSSSFVPDSELPYYYAAADIALIHRKEILNSGNLPMAMMMGKVIVGPNIGNVGLYLKKIGNPTFDINNMDNLKHQLAEAIYLIDKGVGANNRGMAYKELQSKQIGKKYSELYVSMIKQS